MHIWLCLPLRVQSDQLKPAHTHLSSIPTSLTTRQSKQLGDNVSIVVGVWDQTFTNLWEPNISARIENLKEVVTKQGYSES